MGSSTPKDPVVKWLNCIGDSITNTSTSNNFDMGAYPYLVKQEIGGLCKERNFGVAGNTTTQMLARINQILTPVPTVVTIYGGINDYGNGMSDATTTSNLNAMIDAVQNAGCNRIILCNIHTVTSTADSNYNGKRSVIQNVASNRGIPICDFHQVTLINPTDYADGLHLTNSGVQKLASKLSDTISSLGWDSTLRG
jgi:lysophospholipase L1-like esterase